MANPEGGSLLLNPNPANSPVEGMVVCPIIHTGFVHHPRWLFRISSINGGQPR